MEQPPPIDGIPPTVSVSAQNGVEDSTLPITGVSVFDLGSLASGSALGVTLHVADGTLFLQTDVANGVTAAEISGEGTNTITITAEQDAINATLAANGLIYTPGLNFNGSDALTVSANDFRNTVTTQQAAITVSAVNDAPVLAHASPTVTMHVGNSVKLEPHLTVSDYGLDSLNNGAGDYAGATFTIGPHGGGSSNDSWFVGSDVTISGSNLQIGGQTVATYSFNASDDITFSFTSNATTALVNDFLQNLGYGNNAATPGSSVTLDYTFNDGAPHFGSNAGHSTATGSVEVDATGPTFAHETSSVYAPPNDGAVLEPGLTVSDPDLDKLNGGAGDYNGATFTIGRHGGGSPDDGYFIDPTSDITLAGPNNQLQINGQTVATADPSGNVLTISFNSDATTAAVDDVIEHLGYENASATPPDSVTLDYTFDDGSASVTSSVEVFVGIACYCAGTLILTDHGEVAVETLQIGDGVITASGVARPIKWIGKRSYGGRFIVGRKDILPICFKTGSLGDGVPKRDLWISPHHAMYLQGVLIEARDLVNDLTVTQAEWVDEVAYFHIELESHDVIVAEGALSETFVDDDSRGMFNNVHEYKRLYPDAAVADARYCAPRVRDGYRIEAARRAIDARAGHHGSRVDAPALRGHIDEISAGRIAGWAQNANYPDMPVCLDILADGQVIGQVLANRYRADLATAGLGGGRHGFEFIPPRGLAVSADTVEARRSLDGQLLAMPRAA